MRSSVGKETEGPQQALEGFGAQRLAPARVSQSQSDFCIINLDVEHTIDITQCASKTGSMLACAQAARASGDMNGTKAFSGTWTVDSPRAARCRQPGRTLRPTAIGHHASVTRNVRTGRHRQHRHQRQLRKRRLKSPASTKPAPQRERPSSTPAHPQLRGHHA